MPLQTALFAEYEEAQRTVLIGANVTVNCVIGVLLFAVAGKPGRDKLAAYFSALRRFCPYFHPSHHLYSPTSSNRGAKGVI